MKFVRVPRTTEQNADQKFLITTINRGMGRATYNPDSDIFKDLLIWLKTMTIFEKYFWTPDFVFMKFWGNGFEFFDSSNMEQWQWIWNLDVDRASWHERETPLGMKIIPKNKLWVASREDEAIWLEFDSRYILFNLNFWWPLTRKFTGSRGAVPGWADAMEFELCW